MQPSSGPVIFGLQLYTSQVAEFLMLNPVQESSRVQLSEHSFSEDDDHVSFAVSNAHLTGPFWVVLNFLYNVTSTATFDVVTGITTPSSSGDSNIATNFVLVTVFDCFDRKHVTRTSLKQENSYSNGKYISSFRSKENIQLI